MLHYVRDAERGWLLDPTLVGGFVIVLADSCMKYLSTDLWGGTQPTSEEGLSGPS